MRLESMEPQEKGVRSLFVVAFYLLFCSAVLCSKNMCKNTVSARVDTPKYLNRFEPLDGAYPTRAAKVLNI